MTELDWQEEHEREVSLIMEGLDVSLLGVMQTMVEVELEEEL